MPRAWEVCLKMHHHAWMEKDEDLQKIIQSTHPTYARQMKMAWDVKNWDR